jgi:hypothetical protein
MMFDHKLGKRCHVAPAVTPVRYTACKVKAASIPKKRFGRRMRAATQNRRMYAAMV